MSIDIDLKVKRTVKININATAETEDGTRVKATSQARAIKLEVRKPNSYYPDSISIPDSAFDELGEVFAAVRQARDEASKEGN